MGRCGEREFAEAPGGCQRIRETLEEREEAEERRERARVRESACTRFCVYQEQ